MADSKITQLTALTTVDGSDVLPVVDVSTSTTKKVTKDNLFNAVNMTGDSVLNIYTDTTSSLGVGYTALDARTTGTGNTALGSYTLTDLTEGTYNTAVGYLSGADITTGNYNVVFGGRGALDACTTGNGNTAVGGYSPLGAVTTGTYNIGIGYFAGRYFEEGDYNILIGYDAGSNFTGGASADNNIVIGRQAQTTSSTSSNEIILGNTSHDYFSIPGVNFTIDGGVVRPDSDNSQTLGSASYRWSVVYAGTGTINTSDEREKQQIADLDDAERRVAVALKGLIKKFKYNEAVALKGNDARIHVGVIAQEVVAAFAAEGLDATRYALLCYDGWDAEPEQIDAEGIIVRTAREAGNRYGIRYGELLAFIIAAL